jgi:hypothetical protein
MGSRRRIAALCGPQPSRAAPRHGRASEVRRVREHWERGVETDRPRCVWWWCARPARGVRHMHRVARAVGGARSVCRALLSHPWPCMCVAVPAGSGGEGRRQGERAPVASLPLGVSSMRALASRPLVYVKLCMRVACGHRVRVPCVRGCDEREMRPVRATCVPVPRRCLRSRCLSRAKMNSEGCKRTDARDLPALGRPHLGAASPPGRCGEGGSSARRQPCSQSSTASCLARSLPPRRRRDAAHNGASARDPKR